ncbi:hypothetical protein FRC07_013876 [Ceratobasidium sp. 392]|nr:hypothetical protein FRC07_013876 [Ceratobasidium sp. 392]
MIIDPVPIVATPKHVVADGVSITVPSPVGDATRGPFENLVPQASRTDMPEQSPRMADGGHPDYAPPPYETVVAVPPPRASARSLLRKSRSGSTSTGRSSITSGELDLTAVSKARICPRTPAEHTSPCFLRPVPSMSEPTSYQRLPRPFVIDPKPGACTLEDSFATMGTPALYRHDVSESDWDELLGDVRACAQLSSGQRVVSGVLPVTRHLGPPGHLASYLAEQGMKRQKTADVVALLDVWNEKFFKPRRLEVILCRGDKRKSGNDIAFLAPDRMDGSTIVPKQRGGCCYRSRCCSGRKQAEIEKPYRLVVVSI